MKFIQCTKCHSRDEHKKITATKETCESCHKNFSSIPENLKYKSIQFSHNLHTTKNNIECKTCHLTIDFDKIQIKENVCSSFHHKKENIKNCAKCHPVQNNIYEGNILSVKLDPDLMRSGGVACVDCHMPNKINVTKPGNDFCAGCHDASYTSMKTDWVNEIRTKLDKLSILIKSTKNLNLTEEDKAKLQKAKSLVSLIKADGSKGLHNYMVLSSLLDNAMKELNEITKEEN
jgi:hypothetical protein